MIDDHFTAAEVEELAAGERADGDEHLAACARCASAVLATVMMKRRIREVMSGDVAPARLRARVSGSLVPRGVGAPWWIAAAAILATIVTLALLARQNASPDALPELTDMHATMLASAQPVDVLSTDRHTVKPWFEGRLPYAVPVPDLGATPFRLIGGRVVYWRGRQTAYLLLGKGAHRISLFVLPTDDASSHLGAPPSSESVLTWQDHGLTFIAIAGIPQRDLAPLRDAFRQ